MNALKICICSLEIKKLIIERSFKFRIPLLHICQEIGLDYESFMRDYINANDSEKYKITEEKFEKLLEYLGIETRLTIVIKKEFDDEKVRIQLKENYELDNQYEPVKKRTSQKRTAR